MNSLWPATTRLSCIQPRVFSKTCYKLDSLAARLARQSIRPYSISSVPFRRKEHQPTKTAVYFRGWVSPFTSTKAGSGVRAFATHRVVNRYEDLPENYNDEEGLKFRATPLSHEEAVAVFGNGYEAQDANRILEIIHGRRVAGTLVDPSLPSYPEFHNDKTQKVALNWLRENVPVDEVQSAGLRAEAELAEMEEDILSRSERIGFYKPIDGEEQHTVASSENGEDVKSVYGDSGLDFIRRKNEAEFELRETQRKQQEQEAEIERFAQEKETQESSGTVEAAGEALVELRRPQSAWIKAYQEKSMLTDTSEAPQLGSIDRLWPSFLLTLTILSLAAIFPLVYNPPKNSERMFPDVPPAAATILSIIAVNTLILLAWRLPPFWSIGNKYFMQTPGLPRAISLIGNFFSHQSPSHFAANMVVLFLVGSRLHDEIGRANFLSVYMASGALASMVSLTSWVIRANFISASLGASGAVLGVIATYVWLRKDKPIRLFFLPDPDTSEFRIPTWSIIVFILAFDVFGLSKWNKYTIKNDHWAHIGGLLAGIGSAEVLKMRKRHRQKIEHERRQNLSLAGRIREGRL